MDVRPACHNSIRTQKKQLAGLPRLLQKLLSVLIFSLLFATGSGVIAETPAFRIAILNSNGSESVEPIAQDLKRRFPKAEIQVLRPTQIGTYNANLNIALSPEDAQSVLDSTNTSPIIAALTTEYACNRYSEIARQKSQKLDFACIPTVPSPKYFLGYLKLLYPKAPRALIFETKENKSLIDEYETTAKSQGVYLEIIQYKELKDIFTALANLPARSSVIATPDSNIFNRDSLKSILDVSYQINVSVLGYSSGFTRAGALGAVYYERNDIVSEIAVAASEIMSDRKFHLKLRRPVVSTSLNSSVAASMNVVEPSSKEIDIRVKSL